MGAFALQERPSCNAKAPILQTETAHFSRLEIVYLFSVAHNLLCVRKLRKRLKIAIFRATGENFQKVPLIFETFVSIIPCF